MVSMLFWSRFKDKNLKSSLLQKSFTLSFYVFVIIQWIYVVNFKESKLMLDV